MYDVVVMGAGPGGAAAARKCAQAGMKTLLIEKESLPRDKVCTGMIMAVASVWVEKAFGQPIPEEVLIGPHYDGVMIIVPEVGQREVKGDIPHGRRREMDYWMTQQAAEAGAVLWEKTRVSEFDIGEEHSTLRLSREGAQETVQARYLIGAEGANSPLRKALFPDYKVRLSQAFQEWHRGHIEISNKHFNCFIWPEISPLFWDASWKGEHFLVEGGSRVGDLQRDTDYFKDILARDYGFERHAKPEERLACAEPIMFGDVIAGRFQPARGNALLVGDAGGLMTPITAEGIGNSIKSAMFAADAVAKSSETGKPAADYYLEAVKQIIDLNREPYAMLKQALQDREGDPEVMLERLAEYWRRTWVCA